MLLAVLLTILGISPAIAQAQEEPSESERVATLEKRVAELEAMVQQLLQNQAQSEEGAAAAAPSAGAGLVHSHEAQAEHVHDEMPADMEVQVQGIARRQVDEGLAAFRAEEEAAKKKHSYRYGGYVKADVLFSDFSGGPVAGNSVGRDFYLPAVVPVGDGEGQSYLDFHAKETRLFFGSDHLLDSGDKLGTYVELDFMVGDNGDERVSNSFQLRMRHAYFTWNRWLFGQTWNTIFNVSALPENLDFIGPSESTVFGRQPMIRYTHGPWQFAAENSDTTITPFGGGPRIDANTSLLPDFVARYNYKRDWGNVTAAAILRQLRYENQDQGIDSDTTGYGLSLSGRHQVGERDDIRWMISGGSGLGRYISINTVNGAVLDEFGNLHAIDSWGTFASYRHFWSDDWRSNLTLGYFAVDNDVALTGLEATKNASSLHANLLYSPLPKLTLGVEYIFANREIETGEDGDLNRFQFSAKYAY